MGRIERRHLDSARQPEAQGRKAYALFPHHPPRAARQLELHVRRHRRLPERSLEKRLHRRLPRSRRHHPRNDSRRHLSAGRRSIPGGTAPDLRGGAGRLPRRHEPEWGKPFPDRPAGTASARPLPLRTRPSRRSRHGTRRNRGRTAAAARASACPARIGRTRRLPVCAEIRRGADRPGPRHGLCGGRQTVRRIPP